VISQSVTIDVAGAPMPAYLARPDTEAARPAVIVLQEVFGVNPEVKRITDLVAGAGYVGLAINYYHRTHPDLNEPYTPEGVQAGMAAAGAVTKASLREDVGAAIDWLNAQSFVRRDRIATWGFCFGGTVAFVTANVPGLAGAICFYGGHIASALPSGEAAAIEDAAKVRVPLLLAFGGKDAYITPEHVEQIRKALTAAGKSFEIVVYPDQDHAFFRNSGGQLNAAGASQSPALNDAADAWKRVQSFLKEHLE
jgi:carboxymethylenebutenolidase